MNREDILKKRKQVLSLATSLALQETAEKGIDYSEAISKALDEACKRLNIEHKDFIKMFI